MPPVVPPIKCQGIKTKLVPAIKTIVDKSIDGVWIEPFCGSCVVAFNIQPEKALLADTNEHIIRFYQTIQSGMITPAAVVYHLKEEGKKLSERGEAHYYEIRDRFNQDIQPLDFLFLSRACFNGVMRFNRKGKFNVPFCRKPNRFSQAYVTKIANQVKAVRDVLAVRQWEFKVADFRETLSTAREGDIIYADPPYHGRHVDYFNSWNEEDDCCLISLLKSSPSDFILSTWMRNRFRENPVILEHWQDDNLHIHAIEHFYHVGSSEGLRHSMLEALITNRTPEMKNVETAQVRQLALSF